MLSNWKSMYFVSKLSRLALLYRFNTLASVIFYLNIKPNASKGETHPYFWYHFLEKTECFQNKEPLSPHWHKLLIPHLLKFCLFLHPKHYPTLNQSPPLPPNPNARNNLSSNVDKWIHQHWLCPSIQVNRSQHALNSTNFWSIKH